MAADAQLVGRYVWRPDDAQIGGLSGLEVEADGMGFVTLSDRGRILEGRFVRQDGHIAGLTLSTATNLAGPGGAPLEDEEDDSEGLALDGQGGFYVSFEGPARVWHYEDPSAAPTAIPLAADFRRMQENASLEALAILDDGSLIALPERTGRQDRPFPLYHNAGGSWGIFGELPRLGPFLVTGADLGPDGYLYVLERDFVAIGFQSRIRRIDLSTGTSETLLTSSPWDFDNLEGISAWRDAEGRVRLTTVSDNNFLALQKTEFVEFIVTD